MLTFTLALAVAAAALALAAVLRIPAAPPAILGGVALAASGLAIEDALVDEGLFLAATFLVFAVGAQLERQAIVRYRRAAVFVTALFAGVTAAVVALLAPAVGLSGWEQLYTILALTSSSTLLVVDLLRRRRQSFEPAGRITTGISVTQDATVIGALAAIAIATGDSLARGAAAAGLIGVAFVASRWLVPRWLPRAGLRDEEELLLILAALFVLVGAAHFAGLPIVLGAYVAGVVFSRFPVGGLVRGHIASFSDFFTVLFFVLLGAAVGIPSPGAPLAEAALVLAVLLLRALLLLPILRWLRLTVRGSLNSMTLLAQTGEVALIVVLIGSMQGHVGDELVSTIALVVLVSMALTPALSSDSATWWLTHAYPRRLRAVGRGRRGHIVVVGAGEGGAAVLKNLEQSGAELVVIDDDPVVVDALCARGVTALRGDGSDPRVLRDAEVASAAAVVSTMRDLRDNERLLAAAIEPPVILRVFSERDAERARARGGRPVVEAEAAAAALAEEAEALASAATRGEVGARPPDAE